MLGADLAMFIVANICIYAPSLLFAVAVLPRVVYCVYWGIVLLLLFALSMGNYYLTAFTEPGILPRSSPYKRVEATSNMPLGRHPDIYVYICVYLYGCIYVYMNILYIH